MHHTADPRPAPSVTLADIEANIVSEHYFTAREGAYGARHSNPQNPPSDSAVDALSLLTFCVLVLQNGFTVVGTSACVSPENFDKQKGQAIAREKAVDQIWPLMGYALKEKTFIG